jgi:hypothetical protein
MTARDTQKLLQVSKTLFDSRGHFSRRAFDAASGNLVRYGQDLAEMFDTREFQPALIRTRQWIDLTRRRLAAAKDAP